MREGSIEKQVPTVESFMEEHRELVEEARSYFESENLETFVKIKNTLRELSDEYNKDIAKNEDLPPELLNEIVGGEQYIKREEESLKSINDGQGDNGVYHPLHERGGGDFWQKTESEGGVGQVEEVRVADITGHGEGSIAKKAIAFKALRLFKAQSKSESADTFQKLDAFLEDMPFQSATEYLEARLLPGAEGKSPKLEIENAGTARIFIRQRETGAWNIVTAEENEGYETLGHGYLQGEERKTKIIDGIDLTNADIYLASDGLYDLHIATEKNRRFQDVLAEFLTNSAGLSPEAFYGRLTVLIAEAEREGLVKDDITVLRMQVVNGRMK